MKWILARKISSSVSCGEMKQEVPKARGWGSPWPRVSLSYAGDSFQSPLTAICSRWNCGLAG
ncbi:MAG: hypothetical protein GX295_00285 [Syntrophomonadaceae bacterium]|nr:hypothetical protein [Syntrophomonadaceae bacterium]